MFVSDTSSPSHPLGGDAVKSTKGVGWITIVSVIVLSHPNSVNTVSVT